MSTKDGCTVNIKSKQNNNQEINQKVKKDQTKNKDITEYLSSDWRPLKSATALKCLSVRNITSGENKIKDVAQLILLSY